MTHDVLIVGGGHAGAQAAVSLRQNGFAGGIAVAGEEPDPPYERPPLSKDYLAGEREFDRMLLRTPESWVERGITLLPGRRVDRIDPAAHEAGTSDGATLRYGTLIWAAGGHARRLGCPGAGLAGIHSIRTRADVDRLAGELPGVHHVVVAGGGYVGLEAAAVLTKLGRHVTVLEAQDRVLARVAGEPLSRFYEAEHRNRGVDVRLGTTVVRLDGNAGRVTAAHLSDGSTVAAELVIVGIGIVPAVEPLAAAGAVCGNGVRVDALCRTGLPGVYAVGDCAEHRNIHAGNAWLRVESVQNATDQAITAARHICGIEQPYDTMPWFWSNQYDLRLQTIGLAHGYDGLVVRGDPGQRAWTLAYLRQGVVAALDCVNQPRDYVQGRKLVAEARPVDLARLADPDVPLKTL